ncbi:MAG TPA: hypothetical protein VFT55_15465 [Planctomycetota bacterium]|nr:hypothetical protein [Planctomycetota bacterium]
MLNLDTHQVPRSQPSQTVLWNLYGRTGDIYALVVDVAPGSTPLFGQTFDLAFSPSLLVLHAGLVTYSSPGAFTFSPGAFPPGTPLFFQVGEWDPSLGLGSMLASTSESLIVHDGTAALEVSFRVDLPLLTGVFDHTVSHRLQALPSVRRTVQPLPPSAYPIPITGLTPVRPAGARLQHALRASELGANGVRETLTAVRWRPLFGVVVPETLPQFELRASHTDVVPDYTIDPWGLIPVAPLSGLSQTFAQNPRPGSTVSMYSGSYVVQPQALLPNGYLPFPAPQATFVYDGQSTILLETLCDPVPGLGAPNNFALIYGLVLSSGQPYASVHASGGGVGQPAVVNPATVASGLGGSFLFDLELEFVRTTSVATSRWFASPVANPDYRPWHSAAFTPPGTSIALEFRGADDPFGTGATAWSASQDVADGKVFLQFRATLEADPNSTAVPWIDTLVVPIL